MVTEHHLPIGENRGTHRVKVSHSSRSSKTILSLFGLSCSCGSRLESVLPVNSRPGPSCPHRGQLICLACMTLSTLLPARCYTLPVEKI